MASLLQFSERFGHMLSRVFLTLLYFVVLGPFAIFYQLFADPLHKKRPSKSHGGSNWRNWKTDNETLPRARSQGLS